MKSEEVETSIGITLKMAAVVIGQAGGSLRGRSGCRSHGNRREERGK